MKFNFAMDAGISTIRQNNFVQTRHENSKGGKIDSDIIKTKIDIKQSKQTTHTHYIQSEKRKITVTILIAAVFLSMEIEIGYATALTQGSSSTADSY